MMRFLVSTNPTQADIEARVNMNRQFLRIRTEGFIKELAENALSDIEYTSAIALAIENDFTELAETLQTDLVDLRHEGGPYYAKR